MLELHGEGRALHKKELVLYIFSFISFSRSVEFILPESSPLEKETSYVRQRVVNTELPPRLQAELLYDLPSSYI